jgi:hypothetical protein
MDNEWYREIQNKMVLNEASVQDINPSNNYLRLDFGGIAGRNSSQQLKEFVDLSKKYGYKLTMSQPPVDDNSDIDTFATTIVIASHNNKEVGRFVYNARKN